MPLLTERDNRGTRGYKHFAPTEQGTSALTLKLLFVSLTCQFLDSSAFDMIGA